MIEDIRDLYTVKAMGLEENEARKFFAKNDVSSYAGEFACLKALLFKAWENKDVMPETVKIVKNNISSGPRVERVRKIVGEKKWEDF